MLPDQPSGIIRLRILECVKVVLESTPNLASQGPNLQGQGLGLQNRGLDSGGQSQGLSRYITRTHYIHGPDVVKSLLTVLYTCATQCSALHDITEAVIYRT